MPRFAACLLAVGIVVGSAGGCAGGSPRTGSADGGPAIHQSQIAVSVGRCGTGWVDPSPGQQDFLLRDRDTRSGEVSLVDATSGAVYADVEPIGPGSSAHLRINLGSGTYRFVCAMEDEDTIRGPVVEVSGAPRTRIPPVKPLTQADLVPATLVYERYVRSRLPALLHDVTALREAVDAGDRRAAETAWLSGHSGYERLGAAYGAFGKLDAAINGLPNGLSKGLHDPGWSGFHRIEYALWSAAPLTAARAPAAALVTAVKALQRTMQTAQIDPAELAIRAHEISENALQFELTAKSDFGSHSNLATVAANLEGTATVLNAVRSLLLPRYPQFPRAVAALKRAQSDVAALEAGSQWPSLQAVSTAARERLNADLSELAELLAPAASVLEPRRAS